MLCGSLDGRGAGGRMDTCICMAETLICLPETIRKVFPFFFFPSVGFSQEITMPSRIQVFTKHN